MNHASRSRRVCVVGGGIAGLVTAKVLQQDAFDVMLFEKESAIGGVWAASRAYPGLRSNNPRETYAFSDFPHPETCDEFPTAEQVRSYLEAYADHFGLRRLLHLSTEVVAIRRLSEQVGAPTRFEVTVRPTKDAGAAERVTCDYVAVCNGVFSKPSVPQLDGRPCFTGRVVHSSEVAAPDLVRGQRVVVVGAGKSALDCAAMAAKEAASSTLVFRRPHWMLPRYFYGIRMDRLLTTRLSEMLLPAYHRSTRVERVLRGVAAPWLRGWWRAQSWLAARLCRMPSFMRPVVPLPTGVENVGVGDDFYRLLRQCRARAVRARVESYAGSRAIRLDTGDQIDADVVIFATGWRQDLSFLEPDLRHTVERDGRVRLYRHVLPPGERQLGFVGYASSIECPLTSEIAAHWVSQCFQGELSLPPVVEMERDIARVERWAAEVFESRHEGFFIGPYVAHYADDLMSDMGLSTRRTNILAEYLAPFWAGRYHTLAEERRRLRATRPAGR